MAFFGKIGKLLKNSAAKHINQEFSMSSPSLFQAIRSMSSGKVFVGGISYSTDDTSLREAFSRYGEVIDARVIMDRDTGRSRGFGFITFTTTEDASSAIQALDGQDLHGRRIRVNFATERARPGFGGGGGYGGGGGDGGYGGGGYGGGGYGSGGGGYGGGGSGGYGGGGGGYGGGGGGGYGGGGYGGNNRSGGYGSGSYGGGNAETSYTGGGGASDVGAAGGEFSSNSSLGYGGQFGSTQDDRIGVAKDEFTAPLDDNHVMENIDEPDDYAQTRR